MHTGYQRILSQWLTEHWQKFNRSHCAGVMKLPVFAFIQAKDRLGSWHASTRTISLAQHLFFDRSETEIIDVLKHEMAHQYADEVLGAHNHSDETPHGSAFRRACEVFDIAHHARYSLKSEPSPIFKKIRKLLSLAESSNPHEAEAAMARARQLLEKFEIEDEHREHDFHYLYLGGPRKQRSMTEQFIGSILLTFFHVKLVWIPSRIIVTDRTVWLMEICGTQTNLEVAEYVYTYLSREIERLWQLHRRKHPLLKGKGPKRDFQVGLLRGLISKMREDQEEEEQSLSRTLVHLKYERLQEFWEDRHPEVRKGRALKVRVSETYHQGLAKGREIELRKGIREGQSKESQKAIGSGSYL